MTKSYHDILGVTPDATAAEIKRAFNQKARDLHPDKYNGPGDANELFRGVHEAYKALYDAAKLKEERGQQAPPPQAPPPQATQSQAPPQQAPPPQTPPPRATQNEQQPKPKATEQAQRQPRQSTERHEQKQYFYQAPQSNQWKQTQNKPQNTQYIFRYKNGLYTSNQSPYTQHVNYQQQTYKPANTFQATYQNQSNLYQKYVKTISPHSYVNVYVPKQSEQERRRQEANKWQRYSPQQNVKLGENLLRNFEKAFEQLHGEKNVAANKPSYRRR